MLNLLPPLVSYSLGQSPIALAGARLIEVDLIAAVRSNDLFGYTCLIILFFFSVISLAIIIRKAVQFRRVFAETKRFADSIRSSKGDLKAAMAHAREFPHSPLAQMLQEACLEMEMEQWFQRAPGLSAEEQVRWIRDNLERVLGRSIEAEMRQLEGQMSFLATTANVCPFIGLLGTVWGVLAAFQAIGFSGSASIQALAPGVSTALVTTVGGLIAAIPAVVAYNVFASRIVNLGSRMESFAIELTSILLDQFATSKTRQV